MRSHIPADALLVAALAATLGVTGCSTMKVSSDYDPDAMSKAREYQTYAWLPKEGDIIVEGTRTSNDIVAKRVKESVDAQLAEQGYRQAEDGQADFLVGYHVGLAGKIDASFVNTYYGYGVGGWYGPWVGGVYSNTYVDEYTEGTLIIDVVDAEANQLVWRGTAQAEVSERTSPKERRERIAEAVRRILAKFPPK